MASLESFHSNPWTEEALHTAYGESFLNMRPAPEFATGEVVLASLYRRIGWGKSEAQVPARGRALLKQLDGGAGQLPPNRKLAEHVWRELLEAVLASPKQPNQSKKRFLQISPLVPDAAIYSLSARLAANSWNPGQMIARYLQFGEPSVAAATLRWQRIYDALSIDENDDIWSRFLSREFATWRTDDDVWMHRELAQYEPAVAWNLAPVATPAMAMAHDIEAVIELKRVLTRRQWISIVEAVIRLGCASQTMWICQANGVIFEILSAAIRDGISRTEEEVARQLVISHGFWRQGQRASNSLKDFPRRFLIGRLGINLLLFHCDSVVAAGHAPLPSRPLANPRAIAELSNWLTAHRTHLNWPSIANELQAAIELDPRKIAIKQGIGSNIEEFLRHVLGQRQTAEHGLEAYDQGYLLKKAGAHTSAPWIVSPGPVLILAMVHACTADARGPRTVDDLCEFLGRYGFTLTPEHVAESDVGRILRNLGLVLDSPDAEGGMVLINPFFASVRSES